MAFYKKQFNKNRGVYYPQAVVIGKPVDTNQIAERLAKISTVSRADVAAVLAELAGVLADYMSQGKSVRLNGLGTFYYKLDTEGVSEESEFDVQKQIKAVRVQFIPERSGSVTRGSTQTRALVPSGIEWIELSASASTGGSDSEEGDEEEAPDPIG